MNTTDSQVKERPILFNTEMVQALLNDWKTQTRRVMKPQPSDCWGPYSYGEVHKMVNGVPDVDQIIGWGPSNEDGDEAYNCPYGKPGDELWVRETWSSVLCERKISEIPDRYHHSDFCFYKADEPDQDVPWKPSIFMPRWASRIQLLIEDIRVERVQEISEEECKAEGIVISVDKYGRVLWPLGKEYGPLNYMPNNPLNGKDTITEYMIWRSHFASLWDQINDDKGFGWGKNPWVWVVEFAVKEVK